MTATPSSGTNRLLPDDALGGTEIVDVSTVDDFCRRQGLQEIGLLKMDVEGAELRVLRGAERTLRERSVRFILSECDFNRRAGEPHASFEELHTYLSSFGFRVVSFYTAGVDANGWRWGNVLFMKPIGSRDDGFATSPFGGQIKTEVGHQQ